MIFAYKDRGTFIKKSNSGLIFGSPKKVVEIKIEDNLDEISFKKKLGGFIFEHTVSKWIKMKLEKKPDYEILKKECSLKAGET